jgi:2-keto-3-deoxy-L-rhamnonate aldolase RhmA
MKPAAWWSRTAVVSSAAHCRAEPPVLVRLASHDEAQLGRVLDAGVDGVIVPAVESAAQAGQLVQAACPAGRAEAAVRAAGLSRGGDVDPFGIKLRRVVVTAVTFGRSGPVRVCER